MRQRRKDSCSYWSRHTATTLVPRASYFCIISDKKLGGAWEPGCAITINICSN